MCSDAILEFGKINLKPEDAKEKSVIEVGSQNLNGSLRSIIEAMSPSSYLGVDIESGSGVDEICTAEALVERYGVEKFDLVVSTEVLEHVKDWKTVISNLKNILKPNGILLITTRSIGFAYHSAPFDFWRYQVSDMEAIFSDLKIEVLEKDPEHPGVFLKARKPLEFKENNLSDYQIYSIIKHNRILSIKEEDIKSIDIFINEGELAIRRVLSYALPDSVKYFVKKKILRIL